MGVRELIERCRRQQQQVPGQLEMPSERETEMLDMTIGEIELEEMWQRHTHERIEGMRRELAHEWATEEEAKRDWNSRIGRMLYV